MNRTARFQPVLHGKIKNFREFKKKFLTSGRNISKIHKKEYWKDKEWVKWSKDVMIGWRRLIPSVVGVLLFGGVVRADIVPALWWNAEQHASPYISEWVEGFYTNLSSLYESPIVADVDFGTIQFLPPADVDNAVETSKTPHTIDFTGGPGSCSLCLYALLGLGLFSAPRWVRSLSFHHLPEWYHEGGPFQIGHSHAATPDSLCTLQVCYFAPADSPEEDSLPEYRLGIILALWRKSQFTPNVLASRGPPFC